MTLTDRDLAMTVARRYLDSDFPSTETFDLDKGEVVLDCRGLPVRVRASVLEGRVAILDVADATRMGEGYAPVFGTHADVIAATDLPEAMGELDRALRGRHASGTWAARYVRPRPGETPEDAATRLLGPDGVESERLFRDLAHASRASYAGGVDPLLLASVSSTTDLVPVGDRVLARRVEAPRFVPQDARTYALFLEREGRVSPHSVLMLAPRTSRRDAASRAELERVMDAAREARGEVTAYATGFAHDGVAFELAGTRFRMERVSDHEREFTMWCVPTGESAFVGVDDDAIERLEGTGPVTDDVVRDAFAASVKDAVTRVAPRMASRNAVYVSHEFEGATVTWQSVPGGDVLDVRVAESSRRAADGTWERGFVRVRDLADEWRPVAEVPNPDVVTQARVESLAADHASCELALRRSDDGGATWREWRSLARTLSRA